MDASFSSRSSVALRTINVRLDTAIETSIELLHLPAATSQQYASAARGAFFLKALRGYQSVPRRKATQRGVGTRRFEHESAVLLVCDRAFEE